MAHRSLLVTGGAGFIGSHFLRFWHHQYPQDQLTVIDALTYAGNPRNLPASWGNWHRWPDRQAGLVETDPNPLLIQANINDSEVVAQLLQRRQIDTLVNLAAESHVDRSIAGPIGFLHSNVAGCLCLLEQFYRHWQTQSQPKHYRFLQVSTDEIYGSLTPEAAPFTETSNFSPNSPYAASKASADHWVRAYHQTYGLPTLISHCSNNYGPYQYPEKLIPLMIVNLLRGLPLPIYGDGQQVRDWIAVKDHCQGLAVILQRGQPGERYNVGGGCEITNLSLVKRLCALIEQHVESLPVKDSASLIQFVDDRPGHDRRYAINSQKLQSLGWQPQRSVAEGLKETVCWYRDHHDWWEPLL